MRYFLLFFAALISSHAGAQETDWPLKPHDILLEDFTFHTGETLDSITMRVYTFGTPKRDEDGKITNAVMLLHGTGGDGKSLIRPSFAGELFGPGQLLDSSEYYIISPDNLGHGDSSKPSDGMRMDFPRYDYDDMVKAQHRMLTEGLDVESLELIIGTSMGCMHSFVWGQTYEGFVKRFMPLACNAMEIAGRNRIVRKLVIDSVMEDPAWNEGNYTEQPADGLRRAQSVMVATGGNPWRAQELLPTREEAEENLALRMENSWFGDANDLIYQFDSSRNYNPAPGLHKITVPVMWVNSSDDFLNPPEFPYAAELTKRMPKARFVLLPPSPETRGHGTHSYAVFWKDYLAELLQQE